MKILLVGEYSRLHNSLKEGLEKLGHEVLLISIGDDFKKFPSDILLKKKYNSGFLKKVKVGIYKLTGIDITSISVKNQFLKHSAKLKGFDIVQLINESSFSIAPKYEKEIISFLSENNKRLFLLSCGADYTSIRYAFERKIRYSILDPYFNKKVDSKEFAPALKYLKPEFEALHHYISEKVSGIIASDMDYHLPLLKNEKYLGLIPNPINTDRLPFIPLPSLDKICIFHGINRSNYLKKGNDYFEAALENIQREFSDIVEIITVENVPYSEYIEKYNRAHILLDQVFSFDQGYNALEAMAKGKVVFTGAETEFLAHYGLEEDEVCINALADVEYLTEKLRELILNPDKIQQISQNARAFIEREHHYRKAAAEYLERWDGVEERGIRH